MKTDWYVASATASPADSRVVALIHDHQQVVLAYVLGLTEGDRAWAEDIVQETFVRAWLHWQTMTPQFGSVRSWLMRVAHNLVMDEYRLARRRRGEVPLSPTHDPIEPELTDQVLAEHWVRGAMQRLPGLHREALEATYLADRTTTQAASMLDVPVGTVKSRVFYALKSLRTIMAITTP